MMHLGLMVDPRLDRSWKDALDLAVRNGITHIEPCGGGHVPKRYVDPVALAADDDALAEFGESISSRDLRVSALGVFGNPLHPDQQRATAAHEDFVAMCAVAARLGVERVTVVSGLPAGGPHDRTPNWILPSIYPGLEAAYRWQWEERLIPYWQEACRIAAAHDVTICMEPIGGFTVYSPSTFLRLRDACGERLCAIVDPSTMWWMGVDPIVAINQLRGVIGHAHAKDVALDAQRIARSGIVPDCAYEDWAARSWVPRAVGFGHPESFWRDFFTALRRSGYDVAVSIEIEETWMSVDETAEKSVELIRRTLPRDPVPTQNWADRYFASPEGAQ